MSGTGTLPPIGIVYFSLSLLTVLSAILVGYWLYENYWDVRGVKPFLTVIVVGGVLWPGVVAWHVLSTAPAVQRFIVTVELGLGIGTSAAWVWFVSTYTDHGLHRRQSVQGAMVGTAVLYLGLVVTNPSHDLLFVDIVHYQDPFSHGSAVRGPLYFLILAINSTGVTITNVILIGFLSSAGRSSHGGLMFLILGSLSVVSLNVLTILDYTPVPEFEHAAFGAAPFVLFTTISVFRFRLLQIAPVARTTLLESLTDPMLVVDGDRTIADYNRRSTRLWPDIDDHVGDDFARACPTLATEISFPDDGDEVVERVSLSTSAGRKHFSVLLSPVQPPYDADDVLGYAILLRDVTELQKSRSELEHQNRQLDRVSATISHDLRNPLNVADGYVDLLSQELATADADVSEQLEHLDRMTDAHDRMEAIIDDVLLLAREGKAVEERSLVSLEDVARTAWDTIEHEQARLVVEPGYEIRANRSRLLSIFENLFRNAVEHAGPTVEVTVGVDEASDRFFVRDDGPGIPASKAETVFEYGYTDSESGTGLGLSIVETMAESHHWSVRIDTGCENGAKFVFSNVHLLGADSAEGVDEATPSQSELSPLTR
jgi:signal transduction histidine kinase